MNRPQKTDASTIQDKDPSFRSRTVLPRVSLLRTYGYSLAAGLSAALILTGLGFALVSSVRHLLWVRMMKDHPMPPLWLWLAVAVFGVSLVAVWYRVAWAAVVQYQQMRQFNRRVEPLLLPLPEVLPTDLLGVAKWHLIDDTDRRYAFTWGIASTNIAVSKGLWEAMDESARRAVLYHEAGHAIARDPLQHTLLHILTQALRPFGVGRLYQRYLLRREILADTLAISACGGDEEPLLKALLATGTSMAPDASRVGLAGSLEARIAFLETGQLPSWWDQHVRYRLFSTGVAVLLTIGEGVLVWCH